VLGDLELGLGLVRQLRLGYCTDGEHGSFRQRAYLLGAGNSGVYDVAHTVVPGDRSALQVLAGVRMVAELVQLLVALQVGTQPRVLVHALWMLSDKSFWLP